MSRWTAVKACRPADAYADADAGVDATEPRPYLAEKAAAPQLLQMSDLRANCDPYLRWAVLTGWRGYVRAGAWAAEQSDDDLAKQQVRIILQADTPEMIQHIDPELLTVAPMHLKPIPGTSAFSRFATGSLCIGRLAALSEQHPQLRWELSAPLKNQRTGLPGSAQAYHGRQADLARKLTHSVLSRRPRFAKASAKLGGEGCIAVVDFGCPFLHQRFADPSELSSRFAGLWDQGDVPAAAPPWRVPVDMGYGRELAGAALRSAWAECREPEFAFDEARVYAGLNYLIDYGDPRRRVIAATHGAHVLDVAAGATDAVTGTPDAASQARLVFVQFPEATAGDSSGGSLSAHLLDALRYVLNVTNPAEPLVVNISYGSTAGPHDGSSIIEQSIDELLLQRPGNFAVVLAAGNSRQAGLHVRRTAAPLRSALFRVHVAEADSTDSFVEFWYQTPLRGQLEFRCRLPGGEWSPWVPPNAYVNLYDRATGDPVAALFNQQEVPNGKRSLALLALRPTEAPDDDDGCLATPGLWEMEARLEGAEAHQRVDIDAWVERDDPRPFSGRKQTSFVGLEPTDGDETLSSIATGAGTVVVGGFRGSDGQELPYSSAGSRHQAQWPLMHAQCEIDALDPGLRAAAVRSGETLLMNGTSVAAPVMARRIFAAFHEAWQGGRSMQRAELLAWLQRQAAQPGSAIRVPHGGGGQN